jgi:DNA-directed RNA polymerase subunit H (RpoH/RPB5)
MGTYKILERYKVDLVKEKESPKITYDDAILSLLKEHYGEND